MKIKEAVYDSGCSKCGAGKKEIAPEEYGCDQCGSVISAPHDRERTYLEVTVFHNDFREPDHLHFCSWRCVFTFLRKIQRTKFKSDYFVALPYIQFDGTTPGYRDFIKALNAAAK